MLEYIPCACLFGTMALKIKSTKVKFNGDKSSKTVSALSSDNSVAKSKHIIFDVDDDNDCKVIVEKKQDISAKNEKNGEEVKKQDANEKKKKTSKKSEKNRKDAMDIGTLWYQTVS